MRHSNHLRQNQTGVIRLIVKLVVFTATNTLNPGESVKFGLITNEKSKLE